MKTAFSLLAGSVSALALASACGPSHAATDCQAIVEIERDSTLAELSDSWFGNTRFAASIMLASNARVGQDGIDFVGDMYDLSGVNRVCVPNNNEAETLRRRFEEYQAAIEDASVAEVIEVVNTLDPVPADQPYTLVTWVRADQVGNYEDQDEPFPLDGDTWVTLTPHLQDFCQEFHSDVSSDPNALTVRLEQRLGMPPSSAKTHFVEFRLAPDSAEGGIFRPCALGDTSTLTCMPGPPTKCDDDDRVCEAQSAFFYQQYFTAFGTEHPVRYPWTSLGYTFDWAPGERHLGGTQRFIEVGESEYVVSQGTMIEVVDTYTTAQYCSAPATAAEE